MLQHRGRSAHACLHHRRRFPFLDSSVARAADNRVDLYRRVVDPDHSDGFFLGLIQPLGAIMLLAEAQAEWVADLISGVGALPSRHTIHVDSHRYLAEVQRERRAWRERVSGPTRRARLPRRVSGPRS
jgi:dimethylaniline monooxygenase (N-oxide forming)